MKRIEIIANETAFSNLATFENIDQLNETVREYKCKYKETLSNTELNVLDILHRYSAKYKGVSFLRKNNIAELIGKSRRTIIRVCHRLEALGIIRQLPMKRASDMQQTSNAIVIQPVDVLSNWEKKPIDVVAKCEEMTANVTQEPAENVTPVKQQPFLKQEPYIHNTYLASPYGRFKSFVGNFVNDPKLTSKLYGIYLAQTHYIRDIYEDSDLLNIGIQAIKTAFQATKRKRLRNIAGYYHGTLDRMLDGLYAEIMAE
jgi:DNA-binding Lrp family transcriptional regulator